MQNSFQYNILEILKTERILLLFKQKQEFIVHHIIKMKMEKVLEKYNDFDLKSNNQILKMDSSKKETSSNNRDIFELIEKGLLEKVEFHINKNKINVNSRNIYNSTPLHIASLYNHLDIVKFLIRKKANINAQNFSLSTPLNLASEMGHLSIINLLLTIGADANIANCIQDSPLHSAVRYGNLNAVKLLILKGHYNNRKNKYNQAPYDIAIEKNNFVIMSYLLHYDMSRSLKYCPESNVSYS